MSDGDAAPRWEWHGWGGGQVDSDGHGDVTLGVRRGPWRFDLLTDTVEVAWEPTEARGRMWVSARANLGSAELMISPWAEGAPDPERRLPAGYRGVEAGVVRYGPAGSYAGGAAWIRSYDFEPFATPFTSPVTGPDDHGVARGDVFAGVWRRHWHGEVRAGVNVEAATDDPVVAAGGPAPATVQPHVNAEVHIATMHPERGGFVDAWAGWADGQGAVTRTRLGGLTPYVVPMAGAAWGEWWVEDYAVGRIGLFSRRSVGRPDPVPLKDRLRRVEVPQGPDRDRVDLEGRVWADAAIFGDAWGDPDAPNHAIGFGASETLAWRKLRVEMAEGLAPWIPRQDGISRFSVFFRVGWEWAPLGRKPMETG